MKFEWVLRPSTFQDKCLVVWAWSYYDWNIYIRSSETHLVGKLSKREKAKQISKTSFFQFSCSRLSLSEFVPTLLASWYQSGFPFKLFLGTTCCRVAFLFFFYLFLKTQPCSGCCSEHFSSCCVPRSVLPVCASCLAVCLAGTLEGATHVALPGPSAGLSSLHAHLPVVGCSL